MSIRAHIVKKIEYDGELFNLWHDTDLLAVLEAEGITETLDADGAGLMEIPTSLLEEFLEYNPGHPLTENIQRAIDTAKSQGDGYITVYCF